MKDISYFVPYAAIGLIVIAPLAACSASEGSKPAPLPVLASSSLDQLLASPAEQRQARAAWATARLLSPSDFAQTLLSRASDESFIFNGHLVNGARSHFAASLATWTELSAHYKTMDAVLMALHVQVVFHLTATLSEATPRPALGLGTYGLPTYDFFTWADCTHIRGAMNDHYRVSDVPYINHVQDNAKEDAVALKEADNVLAAQWQAITQTITDCLYMPYAKDKTKVPNGAGY